MVVISVSEVCVEFTRNSVKKFKMVKSIHTFIYIICHTLS